MFILTFRPNCPASPTGPIIPGSPWNEKSKGQNIQKRKKSLITSIKNILRVQEAGQTDSCYNLQSWCVSERMTSYLISFRCWPRWNARISFSPLAKQKHKGRLVESHPNHSVILIWFIFLSSNRQNTPDNIKLTINPIKWIINSTGQLL